MAAPTSGNETQPEKDKGPSQEAAASSQIQTQLQASAKRHQKWAAGYIVLALVLAVGGVVYFSVSEGNSEASLKETLAIWEAKSQDSAERSSLVRQTQQKLRKLDDKLRDAAYSCRNVRLNGAFKAVINVGNTLSNADSFEIGSKGIYFRDLEYWSRSSSPRDRVSGPPETQPDRVHGLSDIIVETCGVALSEAEVDSVYLGEAKRATGDDRQYYSAYDYDTNKLDRAHKDYTDRANSLRSLQRVGDSLYAEIYSEISSLEGSASDELNNIRKAREFLDAELIKPLKQRLLPKEDASQYDIINALVIRVGSISLALYLLALFLGFARYHTRMANFYEARGHALLAAQKLAPDSIGDVLKTLDPEKIMFTKEPNMPLDRMLKIAEAFKK